MHVKNLSHDAVNEAYILLSSYLREEGKIVANYNKDHLKEFVQYLHDILKDPKNFVKDEDESAVTA
jgi:hypothetical protein